MKKIIALLLMAMVVTNAYAQQDTVYYNVAGMSSNSPFLGVNIVQCGDVVTKKTYDEEELKKWREENMPESEYKDLDARLLHIQEQIQELENMEKPEQDRKPTFSDSLSYSTMLHMEFIEDVDTIFINKEGDYVPNDWLDSSKLDYDRMVVCNPLNNTLTVYQIKILNPNQSKTIKSSGTRWHDVLVDVNYNGVRGHEWQKVAETYTHDETIYLMAEYEVVSEPEVHEFDFTVYSGKQ